MAETYEVLWSGTKDTEFQKSQQRPATELPLDARQHIGNAGVARKRRQHATSDDANAARIREQWHRENQPIATSGLPRGEPVKT
jgi:hypothetical protein